MTDNSNHFIVMIEEQLSTLSKEDEGTANYKTIINRLILELYNYCTDNRITDRSGEVPSLELVETATECVKYYNPQKGSFLKYFLFSYKRATEKKDGKERYDDIHGGVQIGPAIRKKIAKSKKSTECEGAASPDDLAVISGVKPADIDFYHFGIRRLDDDEGETHYDTTAGGKPADSHLLEKEGMTAIVDAIETVYKSIRSDQKQVVSAGATAKIIEELSSDNDVLEYAMKKTFFDEEIFREFKDERKVPTARELGDYFRRHEASISRTMSNFGKKVRQELSR